MEVVRGMFALRYSATAVAGVAPRVVVSVDPDHAQDVKMLFSPGATAGILRQPGDLCVVTAEREATVLLTILGQGSDRPEAVTLELDRLDREIPALGRRASRAALAAPEAPAARNGAAADRAVPLRIAGHVQNRGDVFVTSGEWLGDPNGSARIEGFSVQWPRRPANVDISYGCALLGLGRMPDVVAGEYVGTRMQARGVNGVSFSLIGQEADAYALIVEARFSDGTHFGPALAPVDLRGATGREHLVALRLQLSEVKARGQRPAAPRAAVAAPRSENAARKPARIFRAPRSAAAI
ncbi:hypothetical protein [Methylobacterium nigriterrae]|uniref:hypothetical protein n=1 Tax=Methylobacterium nigriterrae TaxID=3127512 RepID=UPI0030136F71